mmetsp:Transcript_43629/g.102896  ORF Transcript_43629/g.102896 Transcript_43629/m.102896 type:complete len:212 (-) Transcript_43629:796-1431(-)
MASILRHIAASSRSKVCRQRSKSSVSLSSRRRSCDRNSMLEESGPISAKRRHTCRISASKLWSCIWLRSRSSRLRVHKDNAESSSLIFTAAWSCNLLHCPVASSNCCRNVVWSSSKRVSTRAPRSAPASCRTLPASASSKELSSLTRWCPLSSSSLCSRLLSSARPSSTACILCCSFSAASMSRCSSKRSASRALSSKAVVSSNSKLSMRV